MFFTDIVIVELCKEITIVGLDCFMQWVSCFGMSDMLLSHLGAVGSVCKSAAVGVGKQGSGFFLLLM